MHKKSQEAAAHLENVEIELEEEDDSANAPSAHQSRKAKLY